MKLSLILCSRNDAYMGNSLWRLETTLNYVGERVRALGRASDVEVLVTDWGSDVPLREAVRLDPAATEIVSFVTVPPSLAASLQGDSPFPEVLALNAAARRARGLYIGRIDQDTLVGERFLRWFFDTVENNRPIASGVMPHDALFFANRRNIPYRMAAGSPSLSNVTTFVEWFGTALPIWRDNPDTGVFWSGVVGIWLAHRSLWHECGGYDERLIYYNWMETDMICRLRRRHALIDLGDLTAYDFYHLEHFDPRATPLNRTHAIKNASVDLMFAPDIVYPNRRTWGLQEYPLAAEPVAPTRTGALDARGGTGETYATLLARTAAALVIDGVAIRGTVRLHVWSGRYRRACEALGGRALWRWPRVLWTLWTSRSEARIRKMAGVRLGTARRWLAMLLSATGLLARARRVRLRVGVALDGEVRGRAREDRERFVAFDAQYGTAVAVPFTASETSKTALVISGRCPTIETELCTIKTLQRSGFTPVVLLEDERKELRQYYERAGVRDVRLWSEFLTSLDCSSAAAGLLAQCRSVDELMTCTHAGVRVGMIAVCTALRRLRLGVLDLRTPGVRELLVRAVAASMSAVVESECILDAVRPALVLTDPEYTPKGELFETCLNNGLHVIAQDTAHRSDALMLKRYSRRNRDQHLTTLSACSWSRARSLEWTRARRERLADEVATSYAAGDWFDTPRMLQEPGDLRRALGLDPAKRTAIIFPHMLWDAPVMWGRPLFSSYQEWFVETVGAAFRNTHVNWVIKIHPAHVWKTPGNGYQRETSEMRVLRESLGGLPAHITVIPPDTTLSTLSLLGVTDYCLTVRGTVGVEAARLGIPVLTAGPARYSELGFTIDSASRGEYLGRLARIEETPPLSDDQRELAERFAYGLFLLRPLRLTSVTQTRINVRTEDDWRHAADLSALADWLASQDEDFLVHAD